MATGSGIDQSEYAHRDYSLSFTIAPPDWDSVGKAWVAWARARQEAASKWRRGNLVGAFAGVRRVRAAKKCLEIELKRAASTYRTIDQARAKQKFREDLTSGLQKLFTDDYAKRRSAFWKPSPRS